MLNYSHNEVYKLFGKNDRAVPIMMNYAPTTCTVSLSMNHKHYTIEMDKKVAVTASNSFSNEYAMLQQVRRGYPNYKVITISHKVKGITSGLNFEFSAV